MDGIHCAAILAQCLHRLVVKLSAVVAHDALKVHRHSGARSVGYCRHFINFDHASGANGADTDDRGCFSSRQFDPQVLSRGERFWRVYCDGVARAA